jgi:putative ABC transport system permease protein
MAPGHKLMLFAFDRVYFVKAGPDQSAVAQRIREEVSKPLSPLWAISVEEQREAMAAFSLVLQAIFGLVLVVAVVIAVFSLIASMATTVSERRWEIGVLKALGLRRGQLFRLFLGEAVVLTMSAGVAGTLIGWSIAYLFTLQGAALGEMPVVFTMPYLTVAVTFGVSLVAALIAAYLPTRRLLKRTSAEIFRMVE